MKFDSSIILEKVKDIPPLPQIASRILAVMNTKDYSITDVVYYASKDVALTAEILKVANSAIFSPRDEIKDLRHAIVILGEKNLKSLLAALSMKSYFYKNESKKDLANNIWEHSLSVAIMARLLSQHISDIDSSEAFLLGILHDIGKVILLITTEFYEEIVTIAKKTNVNICEIESNLIGFNHAEVGGYVLKEWKLPRDYYEKVYYHHDIAGYKDKMIALLGVSNYLVNTKGIGLNLSDSVIFEKGVNILNLDEDIMKSVCEAFSDIYEMEKKIFSGD
ncbi:HDOD domain-containing protein [Deferribacter abyssi]|uniref:HDOD domain-containing protein n=1 Tax=Deferribacter abyssi TaxID=213806 RepID=UPI003C237D60